MDLGNWMKRVWGLYRSFCAELLEQKESIVEAIGEGFGKWGRVCYRYPYHVMIASVVVCAAMASGLLPPTPVWIDGAEKLYSLPYSRARDDGALHSSYFGDVMGRKNVIILRHHEEGTNILTWKHLEAAQHMDAIIRGKEVDPVGSRKLVIPRTFGDQNDIIHEDYPGGFYSESGSHPRTPQDSQKQEGFMDDRDYMTLEDICLINPWGECAVDSVLKFGLFEMRQMGLLPNAPEVWVFDGTVYNTKQAAFIPEYYLGGTQKKQCWRQLPIDLAKRLLPPTRIKPMPEKPGFALVDIHCIVKAEALMLQYDIDGRAQFEDRNMMWERLFIQILKDNQVFGDLLVSFQAFRSRDDELRASTSESKDVVYVVFTFFILAAYSTCLNFSCDLYRNKLFSALMGFGAAFMGLGAGMGLVSYMGMPMVPTVLICPFLVLGIGVDDMFVVMNCYCVSYTVHDPEERCVQALRISGLGISITTMTNLISFGVGAFSTYMSIRNFCVYSAMALFMGYVFVLTFFFPTLCIDARREECARVCPFCLPDVSDRQKLAQERLNEVTQEEKRILDIVASITLEELVAYKVRVYYEEQAIKAAAKCNCTQEMQDICTKHKGGGRHFLLRLKEIFTLLRAPPMACTPQHFAAVHRTQPQPTRGGPPSASWACGGVPAERLSPGIPFGEDSARTDSGQRNRREGAANKSHATHPSLQKEGKKKLWFFKGRPSNFSSKNSVADNSGSTPLLTTTIGNLHPALAREALYEEPRGNVGRNWRQFFLCYYGPILMWLPVKIAVVIAFFCIVCVSIYGFTKLEMGLELTELAPSNSYMRRFDRDFAMYFNKFDQPTDIFFVDRKKRPGNSGISDGIAGGSASQRRAVVQSPVVSHDVAADVGAETTQSLALASQTTLSSEFQLQSYTLSPPTLRGADLAVPDGSSDSRSSHEEQRHSPADAGEHLFENSRAVQEGDDQEDEDTDTQFIRTEWWNPRVQASMRALHETIASRPSTSRLINPLLTMLDDPQLGPKLRMGDKQVFEDTIYYQLVHAKSPYRQFKFDFIWTGRELKTWRMRLLPKYMATSEERAAWMQQLRDDCDSAAFFGTENSKRRRTGAKTKNYSAVPSVPVQRATQSSRSWESTQRDDKETDDDDLEPLYAVPYTYMMVFYESDLGILSSVLINMLSAGLAMLLVAFVLIPEARAGLLVILMICLIDLALFGFMYFWKVKLHMVSTIALVISIGFAVDYSAHLCHTFTHCKGLTRDHRAIESLVLMGNPVFHGACSTFLGILLLGFSESFVFSVFFRMMVMVVCFGASHGMVLLPVILSWFGPGGNLNSISKGTTDENIVVAPSNRSASLTPGVETSALNLPLFALPDSSPVYSAEEHYEVQEHLHQRISSNSAPPAAPLSTSKAEMNDAVPFALIQSARSNPASVENTHELLLSRQKSSTNHVPATGRTNRRYSTGGGFATNTSSHISGSAFSASLAAERVLSRHSYDSCVAKSERLHRHSQAATLQGRHSSFSVGGDPPSGSPFLTAFGPSAGVILPPPSVASQRVGSDSRSCVGVSHEGLPTPWIQSIGSAGSGTLNRGLRTASSASNGVRGATSRQLLEAFGIINGSECAASSGTLRHQQSGTLIASTSTESSSVPEKCLRNIPLSSNALSRRHSVTTIVRPGFGASFPADVPIGMVHEIASGMEEHTSIDAPTHFEQNNNCFETSQQQLLLLKTARGESNPQHRGTHQRVTAPVGDGLAVGERQHRLPTASTTHLHEGRQSSTRNSQRSAEDEDTESRITLSTHSNSSSNRRTPLRDSRLPPQQPAVKTISAYRTTGNVSCAPPSLPSALLSSCRHPTVHTSTSSGGVSSDASRTRSAEAAAFATSSQSGQSQQRRQLDYHQPRRRRSTGSLMASRGRGAVVVSAGVPATVQVSDSSRPPGVRYSGARQRSASRPEQYDQRSASHPEHCDPTVSSSQQYRKSSYSGNLCNSPVA